MTVQLHYVVSLIMQALLCITVFENFRKKWDLRCSPCQPVARRNDDPPLMSMSWIITFATGLSQLSIYNIYSLFTSFTPSAVRWK